MCLSCGAVGCLGCLRRGQLECIHLFSFAAGVGSTSLSEVLTVLLSVRGTLNNLSFLAYFH